MHPATGYYRFSPAAVLRFSGEDHAEFLQGQGTADLHGSTGLCQYDLWLDHRGQIHGDGFILKEGRDSMLLVSYACPAATLKAGFSRHIIADDVEIDDLTGTTELVSVSPAGVSSYLVSTGWEKPPGNGFIHVDGVRIFPGRRLGKGTLDVLYLDGKSVTARLPSGPALGRDGAEALRIASGIPMVPDDCPEASVNPVEAGILSAVSFTKGCYLGQEVVARVHRLQRVSKRLVRFTGPDNGAAPPVSLRLGDNEVGQITTVVKISDTLQAIGWLKSRVADGERDFDGWKLSIRTLPQS